MNWKFWEREEDELGSFINKVVKLTPEEFMGLAKLMNIEIVEEDKSPKPGDELLVDVCNSFVVRPKVQRKNLMKLLKETTRLRSFPKFNEEEQARRDSEYEEWLKEQKELIKDLEKEKENVVDAAVSTDSMEEN